MTSNAVTKPIDSPSLPKQDTTAPQILNLTQLQKDTYIILADSSSQIPLYAHIPHQMGGRFMNEIFVLKLRIFKK